MSAPIRPRQLPLLALAAGAALAMTGCVILPPAMPTIPPPALPTETAAEPIEPEPTDPAPTESEPTDPGASAGELPEILDFNTPLEPGTLAGWETSIITDPAFTVQPDSDFPQGPVISVVETETGCTFWAYQGLPDGDDTDEEASSEATLTTLVGEVPEEMDLFDIGPSASQGVTVVFLSTVLEDTTTGEVQAFFVRNFQSSGSTSSIIATCSAEAGGLEHIDEVVGEQFQVNFLQP